MILSLFLFLRIFLSFLFIKLLIKFFFDFFLELFLSKLLKLFFFLKKLCIKFNQSSPLVFIISFNLIHWFWSDRAKLLQCYLVSDDLPERTDCFSLACWLFFYDLWEGALLRFYSASRSWASCLEVTDCLLFSKWHGSYNSCYRVCSLKQPW